MKKFMIGAAAFCCMMISSVALTACGSDDNDDSGKTDPYAPKETVMNVWCSESQDVLDVCDATVTINGETETITSAKWSKTLKSNGLPAHYSISVKVTKKAGKDWDSNKSYNYSNPAVSLHINLIKNNVESGVLVINEASNGSAGGKLMDSLYEGFKEYSVEYDIDKYGKVTIK